MSRPAPEPGSFAAFLRWRWLYIGAFALLALCVGAAGAIEAHPLAGTWEATSPSRSDYIKFDVFGGAYWNYSSICGQDQSGPILVGTWRRRGSEVVITASDDYDEYAKGDQVVLYQDELDRLVLKEVGRSGEACTMVFERASNEETWLDAFCWW